MNRLLVSCAMALALSQPPALAQSKSGFQYNGIVHVSWWFNEYTYAAATDARNALAATNANWAAVLVTWYQDTITSTTITPLSDKTPTDDALRLAIQELHNKGLKVMLKPHVDVLTPGRWRGEINPPNIDAWFASYTEFILNYAQMAQALGAEGFCMGTELKMVSGAANRDRWKAVIDNIRAVYTGVLTYAANASSPGDEFTSVSFWDYVDLIGLDAYFRLTRHDDPTLIELVSAWWSNGWGENLVAAVNNFANSRQKPVIFTELGYRSMAGANQAPWDFNLSKPYAPTEQRNCYDAAFIVWSQQSSWMKGFFWWAWAVNAPGPNDTDYTPRGKPAEDVLRAWQGPLDSSTAVVSAASYRADSVAPGGIAALFGPNLASGTAIASSIPLPTSLADTSVVINGIPAPLFSVSPQQVNAQVPFELAPGSAMAEVTSRAGVTWIPLTIGSAGAGIFTTNQQGSGEAVILDAITFKRLSATEPATGGEWIQIYCTGLGAVTQSVATGDAAPDPPPETSQKPEVRLDGQPIAMSWSGLASGFVGLYAVNAQLPASLSAGTHQLQIVIAGVASNTVAISVR